MNVLMAHLPPGSFNSISAASNAGAVFAPGSLARGFAPGIPAEATVELSDSAGTTANAAVVSSAPGQLVYVVPATLATGRVEVRVKDGNTAIARGSCFVERVAPALFTTTGEASGPAAIQIARVRSDGTQTTDQAQEIRFGDPSERLFLVLYATGVRNFAALEAASVNIGSVSVPVLYIGKQGEVDGLDQVNAELPRSLAGAGKVTIRLKVDGKLSNPATLSFPAIRRGRSARW